VDFEASGLFLSRGSGFLPADGAGLDSELGSELGAGFGVAVGWVLGSGFGFGFGSDFDSGEGR
jgi:hypothetical protein